MVIFGIVDKFPNMMSSLWLLQHPFVELTEIIFM